MRANPVALPFLLVGLQERSISFSLIPALKTHPRWAGELMPLTLIIQILFSCRLRKPYDELRSRLKAEREETMTRHEIELRLVEEMHLARIKFEAGKCDLDEYATALMPPARADRYGLVFCHHGFASRRVFTPASWLAGFAGMYWPRCAHIVMPADF
jgi:hypothetical protein